MITIRRKVLSIVAGGLVSMLFCRGVAEARVKVETTVFPLKEFAAAVAGERGDVSLLLPPGAGVHTWQPRPGDLIRLSSSDLLISIGAGLEPWLSGVLKALPGNGPRLCEVSRGMSLLPAGAEPEEPGESDEDHHEHGFWDPHLWLDFGLDELVLDRIVEGLSAVDPGGRDLFLRNAAAYKNRLRELDGRFRDGLKNCSGKRLVVAGHAAFGYLAKRYGLVQTALYGVSPDAQAKPAQLMKIIDYCRKENVRTVFYEASAPPALAATLAREIDGLVLTLNAGHNLTSDQILKGTGFFEIMEDNLENLKKGLGCR